MCPGSQKFNKLIEEIAPSRKLAGQMVLKIEAEKNALAICGLP
jgi:hypothetical protein